MLSITRKRSLTAAALVAMLALSACGGGNNGTNESSGETGTASASGSSGEAAKLRVTWVGSQARHEATLKALDLYSAANPNITFEPTYMGVDTYYVKLATDSAAKNLPDVLQIDTVNIMDYATRNQLADLSGSSIDRSKIDPNLLSAGELDGKVYGIPLGANAVNLIYNKSALDQLGIDLTSKTLSWDEIVQLAKDVKPKLGDKKYLMEDMSVAVANGESSKYEIYQLSQGKGFLHTPDGTFNIDKDTFVEFENTFAQLRKDGLVPPADVSVGHKQFDPKQDNLLNGNVLMIQSFSAVLSGYDGASPGTYGLAPVPSGQQSGGYLVPSQFFAVSETSKNKEAAANFISWFVNDEKAGEALKFVRGPQVASNVLSSLSANLNDVEKAQVEIIDKVSADANPFTSRPKGFSAWTDEYTKISQQIAFGRMTPEEAYDQLKKKYEEIVK